MNIYQKFNELPDYTVNPILIGVFCLGISMQFFSIGTAAFLTLALGASSIAIIKALSIYQKYKSTVQQWQQNPALETAKLLYKTLGLTLNFVMPVPKSNNSLELAEAALQPEKIPAIAYGDYPLVALAQKTVIVPEKPSVSSLFKLFFLTLNPNVEIKNIKEPNLASALPVAALPEKDVAIALFNYPLVKYTKKTVVIPEKNPTPGLFGILKSLITLPLLFIESLDPRKEFIFIIEQPKATQTQKIKPIKAAALSESPAALVPAPAQPLIFSRQLAAAPTTENKSSKSRIHKTQSAAGPYDFKAAAAKKTQGAGIASSPTSPSPKTAGWLNWYQNMSRDLRIGIM